MAGLVPAIHVFALLNMKRWMPATSAGMARQFTTRIKSAIAIVITGLGEFFLCTFRGERRDILGVAQAAAIAARHASLSDLQAIADAHHYATRALKTDEFERHWDTYFISGSLRPRGMNSWSASTHPAGDP
jgi:hypothetical protein